MRGFAILLLVLTFPVFAVGLFSPGHPVFGLLLPEPLSAQQFAPDDVVLFGRVEDAVSGEPVAGAVVISADSTAAVLADSAGEFVLPLSRAESYVLLVEQLGYAPTTFELSESAPSRISVLAVQPAPLALEGVTVVGESDLEALVRRLDERRTSYSGPVRSFDRERVRRFGADDALDLVLRGEPRLRLCHDGDSLCRRTRGGTFSVEPFSYEEFLVCIDEVYSFAPVSDLSSISIEDVAMADFYGPQAFGTSTSPRLTPTVGQVRIYTRQWMAMQAGRPRAMMPVEFGC